MNITLAIITLILILILAWESRELSECRKQLKWIQKIWIQKIKGTKEDDNV